MNVKEFKKITKELSIDSEIKISNYVYDYTVINPIVSDSCEIMYTNSDGLELIMSKNISTIKDFNKIIDDNKLFDDEEIISWDTDDGNIINYNKHVLTSNSIILCAC